MRAKNMFFIAGILTILLLISSCAKLNEPEIAKKLLDIVYSYNTTGFARDIYLSDQYLYIAEDQGGFSIYDFTTDELICHYVEEIENARLITAAESENQLFVYDRYGSPAQIRVYNISDPSDPQIMPPIIGNTSGIESLRSSVVEPGLVELELTRNDSQFEYKKATWDGFYFVPTLVFDNYTVSLSGFDTDDNFLYLAYEQLGLNITDLATGEIVSITDTPGEVLNVKVVDNFAFIADKHEGFTIINIADPENPYLVYTEDTSGYAQDISVFEDYLAVASGGGGVYLYDISDIAAPEFLDRIDDQEIGYAYRAEFHQGYLFVATKYGVHKLSF